MENNQYLGTEKVGKLLGRFAVPCIFSLIISCLYNIVDQFFVGNGVGYLGNAARRSYYESITKKRWGGSHSYELCVDSSIGVEETADLIFSYIKKGSK